MTQVLITGANGYLGRALAARLAGDDRVTLTLLDLRFDGPQDPAQRDRVRRIRGDFGDPAVLAEATTPPPEIVFHLGGITSRVAETDFALGLRVNVTCTIALFERLRLQQQCPVVVCASSIGVFGPPLPAAIDDATVPAPTLSYGTQKLVLEILLADYSRRGWLDGRSVRLPSVVARPAVPGAALSGFASDLIRELAEGRRHTCPVGPDATLWLLSLPACIGCLLQASRADAAHLPGGRAWNLPALRASVHEVMQALCRRFGNELADRVDYQPQPGMSAQFGQWPPLSTAIADRLGMRHDGDLDRLIAGALAP